MNNDSKVTVLGMVKNVSLLLGAFGLPELDPAFQMKIAQALIVGYCVLGMFKDYVTNKPDVNLAQVLDKLAESIKAKEE